MTSRCRIYLITPPRIDDLAAFGRTLAQTLDAAKVAALQIRLKDAPDALIEAAIDTLSPIAQSRGVAVILNDRPDIAARRDCDGVHIGQSDMPYKEARQIMGPNRMIGVTCHDSRHLAMEAAEAGADYVAFGAFFPTATKETVHRPDIEILTDWQAIMQTPCVAIGGVTVENCRTLADAGADFVAVCSGVWDHPQGPAAAVAAMRKVLTA